MITKMLVTQDGRTTILFVINPQHIPRIGERIIGQTTDVSYRVESVLYDYSLNSLTNETTITVFVTTP